MSLEQTKTKLRLLYNKFTNELFYAKQDIRPDGSSGYGTGKLFQDENEYLYYAICKLEAGVKDKEGPIFFDVDNQYISERHALAALRQFKSIISGDLAKIQTLIENHESDIPHSLHTCYKNYREINDLIDEILQSDEVIAFESPGIIQRLQQKIADLEFNKYWNTRMWRYGGHLVSFIFFLWVCVWILLNKDKENSLGINPTYLVVATGLLTVAFNILFNNHQTFKDSWKLLTPSTYRRLKAKMKTDFLKSR